MIEPRIQNGSRWSRPTRREKLPAYDPTRPCPACGFETVATHYHPPGCQDESCRVCEAENLTRVCQRCRATWAEQVIGGEA